MKIKTKSQIEKLLPEPKPNSEPLLMGIASAPILQNPLLCAVLSLYVSSLFNSVIKICVAFSKLFGIFGSSIIISRTSKNFSHCKKSLKASSDFFS
jgi:hypothetical protein